MPLISTRLFILKKIDDTNDENDDNDDCRHFDLERKRNMFPKHTI